MASFGRFNVSNTGSSTKYEGGVRVYLAGELVGVCAPSSRDPLGYLRKHPGSRYRQKFVAILQGAGATQEEIDNILNDVK